MHANTTIGHIQPTTPDNQAKTAVISSSPRHGSRPMTTPNCWPSTLTNRIWRNKLFRIQKKTTFAFKKQRNMYCRYCGKQIEDDSIFCRHCGKNVNENQHMEILSTEVADDDLANAWTDKYGVKYSPDKNDYFVHLKLWKPTQFPKAQCALQIRLLSGAPFWNHSPSPTQ